MGDRRENALSPIYSILGCVFIPIIALVVVGVNTHSFGERNAKIRS